MRHQLDQARIDQNARADAIEHAIHHQRRLAAGRVTIAHGQADGDGDRRRDAVPERQEIGRPALGGGPGRDGEAGAETEAFEGLVEDEDDVEDCEFGAGDGEGQADEDGVEDDAEFEDEDGSHLGGVVFGGLSVVGGGGVDVGVGARVAEVVVARRVAVALVFAFACLVRDGVGVLQLLLFRVVRVRVAGFGEAHGH